MPRSQFDYCTSPNIKNSISYAYSTTYNSRNLERFWYPAYTATLQEATQPHSDRLIVCPQPDLSIPGEIVEAHSLRAQEDDLEKRMDAISVGLTQLRTFVSSRIRKHHEAEVDTKITSLISEYQNLAADVLHLQMAQIQKELEETQMTILGGDTSMGAITNADGEAIENFPDFSVDHIISGTFGEPDVGNIESDPAQGSDEATLKVLLESFKLQRQAKGGIQVIHHCIALIGEVKAAPSRSYNLPVADDIEELILPRRRRAAPGSLFGRGNIDPRWISKKWLATLVGVILSAINEVVYYCSVYFLKHPSAKKVVGLVASGAYYQWAVIKRKDMPSKVGPGGILGGKSRERKASSSDHKKMAKIKAKFGGVSSLKNYFILGSEGSDQQIAKICEAIYLIMHHSPHVHEDKDVPTALDFTIQDDHLEPPETDAIDESE